ncbi:MAG TPA: TylF/MycF/NovP-related O-methyltransferase [Bryobacteraceae bacterium]|nr:TylF/MycF/NovP-related O-methyltransferase [Bryobacteraceae bacterium]
MIEEASQYLVHAALHDQATTRGTLSCDFTIMRNGDCGTPSTEIGRSGFSGVVKRLRLKEAVSGIAGPILRSIPIGLWPPALSQVTGVLAPRAIVPRERADSAGGANTKMLFEFLDRTAKLEGDIAECGVWRGRTLVAMAIYLVQESIPKTIWGFDSFQGFDASVARDIALGGTDTAEKRVGGFEDTSYALVNRKLSAFGLHNVQIRPGYFRESLPGCNDRKFCFVHLDCDIYESYAVCLDFFYPRLVPGGVLLFDEYNDPAWPGANCAVDEFFANQPDKPQSIVRDNFEKWFVVKS